MASGYPIRCLAIQTQRKYKIIAIRLNALVPTGRSTSRTLVAGAKFIVGANFILSNQCGK